MQVPVLQASASQARSQHTPEAQARLAQSLSASHTAPRGSPSCSGRAAPTTALVTGYTQWGPPGSSGRRACAEVALKAPVEAKA